MGRSDATSSVSTASMSNRERTALFFSKDWCQDSSEESYSLLHGEIILHKAEEGVRRGLSLNRTIRGLPSTSSLFCRLKPCRRWTYLHGHSSHRDSHISSMETSICDAEDCFASFRVLFSAHLRLRWQGRKSWHRKCKRGTGCLCVKRLVQGLFDSGGFFMLNKLPHCA